MPQLGLLQGAVAGRDGRISGRRVRAMPRAHERDQELDALALCTHLPHLMHQGLPPAAAEVSALPVAGPAPGDDGHGHGGPGAGASTCCITDGRVASGAPRPWFQTQRHRSAPARHQVRGSNGAGNRLRTVVRLGGQCGQGVCCAWRALHSASWQGKLGRQHEMLPRRTWSMGADVVLGASRVRVAAHSCQPRGVCSPNERLVTERGPGL
mmetsp:Transcript_1189/g.3509  ORF Transcript_1189/g.3509 Transcript_1189/m.3509 type:complete len:210 (-) Transcript_1189:208-837(-)